MLHRRRFLTTAALLGVAGLAVPSCSTGTPPGQAPGAAPDSSAGAAPGDVAGLLAWIAADPQRISVMVDDGRGAVVRHLPDRARPVGSAAKVLHLTAYADAVATGRIDPQAPVPVAEWERWWVPGTDAGAHLATVAALGVDPAVASATVGWPDLISSMIGYSDNAVPDLLREVLGDDALRAAGSALGWADPDLPSFGGEALLRETPPAAGADRRAAAVALLRAYAADPAARAAAGQRAATIAAQAQAAASDPALAAELTAEVEEQIAWNAAGPTATADQVAAAHRAAAGDTLGLPLVRAALEQPLTEGLPDGVLGIGLKGGSLPGLIAVGMSVRRDDGSTGVSALLISGAAQDPWFAMLNSSSPVQLARDVQLDPTVLQRLADAVG